MNHSSPGKTAAIIAEYNPFHNGHARHIVRTREATGAEAVVVIMSGNFVQRGDCAVADKYSRARMALLGGADLVIELPLPFACAGAETFSQGGVGLADALGCVDYLSFGMECGSTEELTAAANALSDAAVKPVLDRELAQGKNFAAARTQAIREVYGDRVADILCRPNNTLAVEYIRALHRLRSPMLPVGMTREGADHDSLDASGQFASATAIRKMLHEEDWKSVKNYLPAFCYDSLTQLWSDGKMPADLKICERAILSRLRGMTKEQLARLPDVSEGLENRVFDSVRTSSSLEELYASVKSKRYSHARIRRIILSAFLGVRSVHSERLPYIRILGMNARGRGLLSAMRPRLPLITTYRQTLDLPAEAQNVYRLECHADDLWALMTPRIQPCGADMTEKLMVM